MAYPPVYERTFSFSDYEVANPGQPKPGVNLDGELDDVSLALTATQENLALIQRSDGQLANDSVGEDQLQADLFDGIVDGVTDEAEGFKDAAEAAAAAAATSASSASASAAAASLSADSAEGSNVNAASAASAAMASAVNADASADDAAISASEAQTAANETDGDVAECQAAVEQAFNWAEYLAGPVAPAPLLGPGGTPYPEAVDDGLWSSKWWALRARDYNATSTVDFGAGGEADIGEAYTNWEALPGNDLPIGQVYATWGTPVQTYVLTDHGNPQLPESWTNITGGPGPPNVLSIGTVLTGVPGSAATVSITGTSPAQVLNFSIPQGIQGIQGIQGDPGPAGTVTFPLLAPNGNAGAPTYSFASDPDTGMYLVNTNTGVLVCGGAVAFAWLPSEVSVQSGIPFRISDGSTSNPSLGFGNDNNTGFYSAAGDDMRAVAGGTWCQQWTATGTHARFQDGAAGTPSITFAADTDTGMYRAGADDLRIVTGGVARATFTAAAIALNATTLTFNGSAIPTAASDVNITGDWYFDRTQFFGLTAAEIALIKAHAAYSAANDAVWLAGYSKLTNLNNSPNVYTYRFNGAYGAASTAVALDDPLFYVIANGSNGAGGTNQAGFMRFVSLEAWSATKAGTAIDFYAAPIGATANTSVARLRGDRIENHLQTFARFTSDEIAAMVANSGAGIFNATHALHVRGIQALTSLNTYPLFVSQQVNGAFNATTGIASGNFIGFFQFKGSLPSNGGMVSGAEITVSAPAAWTSTNTPTQIDFWLTANGTTGSNRTLSLSMDATSARFDTQRTNFVFTKQVNAPAFAADAFTNGGSKQFAWNVSSFSYGSSFISGGPVGGYIGLVLADGGPLVSLMSSGVGGGIYCQGDSKWLIQRNSGTIADCSYTLQAVAFNPTSSRAIKRETGKPSRVRDMLARLRPIFYRMLADESVEQIGMIAEEVHDICPQLSNGKTICYDRLAVLLLADWQESHGLT